MDSFERALSHKGCTCIIGVDEAGRGPLAGPVVAAAVWLKTFDFDCRIDDSKRLSSRQRHIACLEIMRKAMVGVGVMNERVIDQLNIAQATRRAMESAVESVLNRCGQGLDTSHILVDGPWPIQTHAPCTPVIDGDARSISIAAASIIAKVTRDRMMMIYDRVYPGYEFHRHKGYPTRTHKHLIKRLGPSPIHRASFSWL